MFSGVISIIGGILLVLMQILYEDIIRFGTLSIVLPAGAIGLGFVIFMTGLEIFFHARTLRAHRMNNEGVDSLSDVPTNDNGALKKSSNRKMRAFI